MKTKKVTTHLHDPTIYARFIVGTRQVLKPHKTDQFEAETIYDILPSR